MNVRDKPGCVWIYFMCDLDFDICRRQHGTTLYGESI